MASDAPRARRRVRPLAAWIAATLIVGAYVCLPDADESESEQASDDLADEAERLEIRDVTPSDPYAGSSVRVTLDGVPDDEPVRVYAGKLELPVLARRADQVVARLPAELKAGALKIRVAQAADADAKPNRSKPYFVRIKEPNPRKIFRNLLGGAVLIAIGITLLSRGVRESTGVAAARRILHATRRRSVSYVLGVATGALAQSTTSSASILAALASSGLLSLTSAAVAFVGAQAGASIAPLLIAGLLEPREGLIAVAIGAIFIALSPDRRAAALGRAILGAGFIAFGLQVFRPGLEPFVSDSVLIAFADRLHADTALEIGLCAALGAVLVAATQGPAPVLVLILALAQTTGRWDLATALALLAGTGLGAALGALLTASGGGQARKLSQLHLRLGAASTALAALLVWPCCMAVELALGREAVYSSGTVRADLGDVSLPLALGFALMQLPCALVVSLFAVGLGRRRREAPRKSLPASSARRGSVRSALGEALSLQQAALEELSLLARTGARTFGQRAEHALLEARSKLEPLADGQEAEGAAQAASGRVEPSTVLACMQLQRSLEDLLTRAERATEARLGEASDSDEPAASDDDDRLLHELHTLLTAGLARARRSIVSAIPLDLDEARDREIRINLLEARARRSLHEAARSGTRVGPHLELLEVVNGYEVLGNQLYRLSESMSQPALMISA